MSLYKDLYVNVYGSLIHNSQDVVYLYNEILIHKKEQNTDTYYSIDKSQKYYVNFKKPDTKDHILHNSIYMNYPEKAFL